LGPFPLDFHLDVSYDDNRFSREIHDAKRNLLAIHRPTQPLIDLAFTFYVEKNIIIKKSKV